MDGIVPITVYEVKRRAARAVLCKVTATRTQVAGFMAAAELGDTGVTVA